MSSFLTLGLFVLGLLVCIVCGWSILYALVFGYLVFFLYGLRHGHTAASLLHMSWNGIKTVKNILLTFILIGMITAVWRACGTIAFIIYHASRFITPGVFLLAVFLLCCLVSLLTGTAFGTAATAGVICMTISNAMGVMPMLTGGAILSGIFFGDRCSPMSTSALLISELTGTDIYRNIRRMLRSAAVPFAASCALYLLCGLKSGASGGGEAVWAMFAENFCLHWTVVIPAVLVLVLAACHVKVRVTMGVSVAVGCVLCLAVQGMDALTLLRAMATGYRAADPAFGVMMNGGGLTSMLRVAAIVSLSSSYAGLFNGTGLLDGLHIVFVRLSEKVSPFGAIFLASIATSMAACNQTLAIMLTHQLCGTLTEDHDALALDMEDTVVVISPLVPWSIAGAMPLVTVGAPTAGIAAAFYLFLLPIWRIFCVFLQKNVKKHA